MNNSHDSLIMFAMILVGNDCYVGIYASDEATERSFRRWCIITILAAIDNAGVTWGILSGLLDEKINKKSTLHREVSKLQKNI